MYTGLRMPKKKLEKKTDYIRQSHFEYRIKKVKKDGMYMISRRQKIMLYIIFNIKHTGFEGHYHATPPPAVWRRGA